MAGLMKLKGEDGLWHEIIAIKGADGEGSGDMLISVYDPNNKNGDAFSADNHVSGTTNKVFTATEQTKLSGIDAGANAYTHPANHLPSIITQDASNRFVTDTEKSTWNGKQASITASGILKGNGSAVSAATAGTDYAVPGLLVGSLSLPTTGYAGSGPYAIAFTVTGATTDAGKRYLIIPDWSSTAATRALEKVAWNLVDDYEITSTNTLTVTVTAVPVTAVPFSLKEVV